MLINVIKADYLTARKDRTSPVQVSLLGTLISDCERVGKDKGNRPPTNAEVITTIGKFLNGIELVLKHAEDSAAVKLAQDEKAILESYLPVKVSQEVLHDRISAMVKDGDDIKMVMKTLKAEYDATFDARLAKTLYDEIVSQLETSGK